MSDAMVTGRMSQQKKNAGGRVLKKLGVSASQAINQLYDYLISNGALPFEGETPARPTAADMQQAKDFVVALQRPNKFSTMTDAEIKRSKAKAKGYL